MPGSEHEKILEIAADQFGYTTTAQARERGVSADTLRKMAARGTLERVSWGVYRVPTFPTSRYAQYMEASLWPAGVRGVISHQSALALYGLSDVSPSQVHITVPEDFRVRREIPPHLEVHHADLEHGETRLFEGIPATTPRRTIEDCHRAHLGPALLRQALEDAEREGFLTPEQAADPAGQVSASVPSPQAGAHRSRRPGRSGTADRFVQRLHVDRWDEPARPAMTGSPEAVSGYDEAMSIDELEDEAMKLDSKSRARLAEKLLASLDDLSEEEKARLWAEEAARRNASWDKAAGDGQPADEVFREARARVE